jgi:hypothetical protein
VPYNISIHKHRFGAWTAGRAASVNGCRFKVKLVQTLLEAIDFDKLIDPKDLPDPISLREAHREWRNRLINAGREHGLALTHGVAAKILNVYLKTIFVCGGFYADAKVKALHPPIDSILLDTLYKLNVNGQRKDWQQARKIRWSLLSSSEYEDIVTAIRKAQGTAPLWEIEQHWRGHQS